MTLHTCIAMYVDMGIELTTKDIGIFGVVEKRHSSASQDAIRKISGLM